MCTGLSNFKKIPPSLSYLWSNQCAKVLKNYSSKPSLHNKQTKKKEKEKRGETEKFTTHIGEKEGTHASCQLEHKTATI